MVKIKLWLSSAYQKWPGLKVSIILYVVIQSLASQFTDWAIMAQDHSTGNEISKYVYIFDTHLMDIGFSSW